MRTLILLGWLAAWPTVAVACPFCEAIGQTMAEEIATSEIAVLAKLVRVDRPQQPAEAPGQLGFLPDEAQGIFQVQEVLKAGTGDVAANSTIKTPYAGSEPVGTLFLLKGYHSPELYWATPQPLPGEAPAYLKQVMTLPLEGPDRLRFFFKYLQHAEPTLDKDAYDEFAKAPYTSLPPLAV